jgi:RNA polymerase sigma-70 factor (ECF subfamily)
VRRDPLARPEQTLRRLYSYVAYRIGPGPDAEDVVSETVERALRYRDSYDERRGLPVTWLIGIATRVLADAARERGREVPAADVDDGRAADDFAPAVADALDLAEAVQVLDPRSRELIALRYGADLRAREIAELLGERKNTVEVALHRALGRLRVALESGEPRAQRPSRIPLDSISS